MTDMPSTSRPHGGVVGEMLKATPKNQGAKGSAVPNRDRAQSTDETPTLSELGIDKKTSSVAQALANLSDAAFEEVREGNPTIKTLMAAPGAAGLHLAMTRQDSARS